MTFRCDLDADALSAQSAAWRELGPAGLERELHGDRFRITFDASVYETVGALVATEQGCCSWAKWDLARQDGAAVLEVSGPAGQIASLAQAFGL